MTNPGKCACATIIFALSIISPWPFLSQAKGVISSELSVVSTVPNVGALPAQAPMTRQQLRRTPLMPDHLLEVVAALPKVVHEGGHACDAGQTFEKPSIEPHRSKRLASPGA